MDSPLGLLTTTILVLQDFLPVPMLIAINFMGSNKLNVFTFLQVCAGAAVISLLIRELIQRKKIEIKIPKGLHDDHELQIFLGLLLCFGSAWITQFFHLSGSIGALVAGLIISHSTGLRWLGNHLLPFRIFCLSLFFLSICLQIDTHFILKNARLILTLVLIIMLINSIINAVVFRLLGESTRNSLYAGALLSQIGEFSLVLCIVARNEKLVTDHWYQFTLAVISLTILVSAVWINFIRKYFLKWRVYRCFAKKNWHANFIISDSHKKIKQWQNHLLKQQQKNPLPGKRRPANQLQKRAVW